jgi:hypothetical protein
LLQPSTPKPHVLVVGGLFREAVEDVYKFGKSARLLWLALDDAIGHTPFNMELEHRKTDSVERRLGCRKLLQKLDTESRLLNHPADASNLALNAVQSRHE